MLGRCLSGWLSWFLSAFFLALALLAPLHAQAGSPGLESTPISTTVGIAHRGQLEVVGQVGGELGAVAVAPGGRHVFLGEGVTLTAWTIDANGLHQVGASRPLGGLVADIELAAIDSRLYGVVAAQSAGLFILDLTDPAQPKILSRLPSRGSAVAVALGQRPRGGLGWLYVSVKADAAADQGLWVVDASDPGAPVDWGIRQQFWIGMDDLAVAGDQLVAVYSNHGYDGGIQGYDVADPLAPRKLGSGRAGDYKLDWAFSVALVPGDNGRLYAYSADLVIDVTPGGGYPIVHTFTDLPYAIKRWCIDGDRAYILYQGTLRAYDIGEAVGTSPANPLNLGAHPAPYGELAVRDGTAAATDWLGAIQAIDVRHFGTLQVLRRLEWSSYNTTTEVELSGKLAFVVHGPGVNINSLSILDMTDPLAPQVVSNIPAAPMRVRVAGKDALLVSEQAVRLFDVGDPAAPKLAFDLNQSPFGEGTEFKPQDAALLGDRLFVASTHGLALYAIGEAGPAAPVLLATVPTPGWVAAVQVRREGERVLLYAAEGPRLRIYDVTNPGAPIERSVLQLGGAVNDIDVDAGLVYAAVSDTGMQTVDAHDPAEPTVLSTRHYGAPIYDWHAYSPRRIRLAKELTPDGRRLVYLASDALVVADVTDPAAPLIYAGAPMGDRVQDVEAAWPWVYYGERGGLRIARMPDGAALPAPLGDTETIGNVETLVAEAAPPDGRVYANLMTGPLTVLDLTAPQTPAILARTLPSGNTTIDAAQRGHLYLWEQGNVGYWYDASGTTVGSEATIAPGVAFVTAAHSLYLRQSGDSAWLLAITGSLSYPGDSRWNGLRLFDVTNGRPVPADDYTSPLDQLPCLAPPAVVRASNGADMLYVVLPEGVLAFDLSAPEPLRNPVKVFDSAAWLASDERYLYRGLGDGWEVYDVGQTPLAPVLLATHRTAYSPGELRFSDGRGWTSDGRTLYTLDLADLAHPVEVAATALPPSTRNWSPPAIAGRRVYYAGGAYGAWVMEYRPTALWFPLMLRE